MTDTTNTTKVTAAMHVAALTPMHVAWVKDAASFDAVKCGTAMAAVHVSQRAAVQNGIMKAIFTTDGADHAVTAKINATWSDLSDYAATATRAKHVVDQNVDLHFAIIACDTAAAYFRSMVTAPMDDVTVTDRVKVMADAIVTACAKGGTGTRTTWKDTVADVVAAGALMVGDHLVGAYGDYKATIADGGIKVNGKTFDNPTAAAVHAGVKGPNGWAFWCVAKGDDKTPIGTLRTA